MRFPSGALFHGSTSYSYAFTNTIQVIGTAASMTFDPSMEYHAHRLRVRDRGQDRVIQWSPIDQFAREMDHFCMAITDNIPVVADGEEGLQDVRLMLAILEAGRTGRPVVDRLGLSPHRRSGDRRAGRARRRLSRFRFRPVAAVRLRLGHQRVVELVGADRGRAGLEPAEIVLEDRPFLDRAEHHAPADLRADIDVGGGELVAADIGAVGDSAWSRASIVSSKLP